MTDTSDDFNRKWEVMKAICPDINLRTNINGLWYVSTPGIEMAGDGFLRSLGGTGYNNPYSAITSMWTSMTKYSDQNKCIAIGGYSDNRRNVRWNGFFWQDFNFKNELD